MNLIEKTCPFIFQGHGHHFPLHPLPSHPHFTFPSLPFATSSPKKNPFRGHGLYWSRPPPRRWPPAAAGPRCRGRCALRSAPTSSLGAPAEVAKSEGPVSCMVRWFFPSETMPQRWKNLCWSGHRFGLDWETHTYITFITHAKKSALSVASYHSNMSMHWPEKIRACKFIKLSLY